MPAFNPIRSPFLSISFLIVNFVTLIAEPISQFSIHASQTAKLRSDFALLGDAKLANGDSRVNLTTHLPNTAGAISFRKPFKLIDPQSRNPLSFSTEFVFSISPGGHGDGLAFIIVPSGDFSKAFGRGMFGVSKDIGKIKGKFVAVEFGSRKGGNVGVDVGRFVSDVTRDVKLLNGGGKVQSWIDYEAGSKRLEVRLSKFGGERPYEPLISFSVDLLRIWGGREVLVGIGSSSKDSAQIGSVYSWSFRVRTVPNGLHSMPLDPRGKGRDKRRSGTKKNCGLRILGGVIFATGCGTLVAFFILLLWVVFFSRCPADTAPEVSMKPLDFNYQKLDVNVGDHSSLKQMS